MFEISLYTLHKNEKERVILYENLCMKLYLNDEKTHVDPCPHNGIQLGLKDHCGYWLRII